MTRARRAHRAFAALRFLAALAGAIALPAGADSLTGITGLSAGHSHTCALTASGGVKCWGSNASGQLGDGTTIDRRAPVDVIGLASGVAAIAAGGDGSCAILADGTARCWGQVAGATLPAPAPLMWPAPLAALSIRGGLCGLDTAGAVSCTPLAIPAEPAFASGNRAVVSRPGGACFITAANGVRCVGNNFDGQLGDGTTVSSTTATVQPTGLGSGVASMAANDLYACAVVAGGEVKCWGSQGGYSISYVPPTPSPSAPASIAGLAPGVTAVTVGPVSGYRINSATFVDYSHACALDAGGGVRCWGDNARGQLGNGSTTSSSTPVEVAGLASGAVAIAAGADHTCALMGSGEVRCWGANGSGQLGDGESARSSGPVEVVAAGGVRSVSAGAFHTCAVTTTGGAKCWGLNSASFPGGSSLPYGTLGDGGTANRHSPVDVVGLGSGVTSISAGSSASCARLDTGGVKCWGYNSFGEVGDGTTTTRLTPVDVAGLAAGMVSIDAGTYSGCAVPAVGSVKCWGFNGAGELGDGTTSSRLAPVDVVGLAAGPGNTTVAVGQGFACARRWTGDVACWGAAGQLGDGSTANRPVPGLVPGLPLFVAEVVAGMGHACARDNAGGVWCWGGNAAGQLGDGTTVDRPRAVGVDGLASGAIALAAGSGFNCVVVTGGGVRCWGSNDQGQLGDGTTTSRTKPVTVRGLPEAMKSVTAGVGHACAVSRSDRLYCWGSNGSGQLGANGTGPVRALPVAVRASIAVTVSLGGAGAGRVTSSAGGIDCGATCTADFAAGSTVTLTATPSAGSTFGGWSGDCAGTGPCVLAADSARRVEAAFVAPRLVNLSTRLKVLQGDDVLIGGFAVSGAYPKRIVVRARGESLGPLGVAGALADPALTIYSTNLPIASNDDWGTAANAADLVATGFAPAVANESAILITLEPGLYTAIVSGSGGATGVGLVEAFEVDSPERPMTNISTRGRVSGGDDVMIAGFIIQGEAPQTVLVRARGPSLRPAGIVDTLDDPQLELYSGPTVIARNDDWQASPDAATVQSSGFAPTDARESVIRITLNPGAYTAIVSGKGGATGVGIVEVFAQ